MNDFPWLTALIVVPLVGAVVTAALPYEGDKSQDRTGAGFFNGGTTTGESCPVRS